MLRRTEYKWKTMDTLYPPLVRNLMSMLIGQVQHSVRVQVSRFYSFDVHHFSPSEKNSVLFLQDVMRERRSFIKELAVPYSSF
jgi:hypothetical protein